MAADRAAPTGLPRQRQQGRRPADRARHRSRSRVAAGRRREHSEGRADRRAAAPPSDGRRRLARRVHCTRGARSSRVHARGGRRAAQPRDAARPSASAAGHDGDRRPGARQDPSAAGQSRVDDVRGRGADVHGQGARAHDQARHRRRRRPWRCGARRRGAGRDPRACRPSLPKGEGPPASGGRASLPLPHRPPGRVRPHRGDRLAVRPRRGRPSLHLAARASTECAHESRPARLGHTDRRFSTRSRGASASGFARSTTPS